jgi:hypothetical protein
VRKEGVGMNAFLEAVERQVRLVKETEEVGQVICRYLLSTLKPIIPDLECQVGDYEAGVETIALFSKSLARFGPRWLDPRHQHLESVILEALEKYGVTGLHLDAPSGIPLLPEEAERVRQAIDRLLEEASGPPQP